jgi:hypothetical protein
MMFYPLPEWHRQQLMEEAEAERLAAQLPRRAAPQFNVHIRRHLAHALLVLASWLSPDVVRPASALHFATRRNGTA